MMVGKFLTIFLIDPFLFIKNGDKLIPILVANSKAETFSQAGQSAMQELS